MVDFPWRFVSLQEGSCCRKFFLNRYRICHGWPETSWKTLKNVYWGFKPHVTVKSFASPNTFLGNVLTHLHELYITIYIYNSYIYIYSEGPPIFIYSYLMKNALIIDPSPKNGILGKPNPWSMSVGSSVSFNHVSFSSSPEVLKN